MKKLLFQLDTDPVPSSFDVVAAYDGGSTSAAAGSWKTALIPSTHMLSASRAGRRVSRGATLGPAGANGMPP